MAEVPGADTFATSGDAYDSFMGRYSRSLAPLFADAAGIASGQVVLDAGCGPGALTEVLAARLGPESVVAIDPSEPFVQACASHCPEAEVRVGRVEDIPFETNRFDAALSQLVFHFVADPAAAMAEFQRVIRSGGTVAACVWDSDSEMEVLRHFWDAALTVDPHAADGARNLRFGKPGEIAGLLVEAGLLDVTEATLEVSSTYSTFDELWNGFLAGIGPAGAYCVSMSESNREATRLEFYRRLGSPDGSFELHAVARVAVGRNA